MKRQNISRDDLRNSFLQNYFQNAEFEVYPIPADASFRTYDRISFQGKNFILMNSPPVHYNLAPFIKIAELLCEHKLSAPLIFETDAHNGFMLLEDFGNISIAKHLLDDPEIVKHKEVYGLIVELLVEVQKIECKPHHDLPLYDATVLLKELELYTDWYVPFISGKPLDEDLKQEFLEIWQEVLKELPDLKPCLVLRDFHVENMMLIEGDGINAIGLLDFQDAVIGNPLYDLVSVLEDARIEVSEETREQFLSLYLDLRKDILFQKY